MELKEYTGLFILWTVCMMVGLFAGRFVSDIYFEHVVFADVPESVLVTDAIAVAHFGEVSLDLTGDKKALPPITVSTPLISISALSDKLTYDIPRQVIAKALGLKFEYGSISEIDTGEPLLIFYDDSDNSRFGESYPAKFSVQAKQALNLLHFLVQTNHLSKETHLKRAYSFIELSEALSFHVVKKELITRLKNEGRSDEKIVMILKSFKHDLFKNEENTSIREKILLRAYAVLNENAQSNQFMHALDRIYMAYLRVYRKVAAGIDKT